MPVFPHIETSQLICTAIQLTGFYMRATLLLNGLTLEVKLGEDPYNALNVSKSTFVLYFLARLKS